MDAGEQTEDFVGDAVVNASASDPPTKCPVDRKELRRKRIDDYRDEGLARPLSGEACVTAVNADLFEITSGIGEVIKQTLADGLPTMEIIGELEPAFNSYLR